MRPHVVHIDNRSLMSITGVNEVESFHEQEIVLQTDLGGLRIEGEGLHLTKLNLDDGQVMLEGEIYLLEYEPAANERSGLFSRIFK
ncbi:MAG: Spore protein YabP [Firmicutes bacterium ADurb.Bin356]|nr:MAG: Spore protein YabP [Firmicutes bacterium ADurb.Bin356]